MRQNCKYCTDCGFKQVKENENYCNNCVSELRKVSNSPTKRKNQCSSCGEAIQSYDKFCCTCGEQNEKFTPNASSTNWIYRFIQGFMEFFKPVWELLQTLKLP